MEMRIFKSRRMCALRGRHAFLTTDGHEHSVLQIACIAFH